MFSSKTRLASGLIGVVLVVAWLVVPGGARRLSIGNYDVQNIESIEHLERALGFKLNHTLPAEIAHLSRLTSLRLDSQGLVGSIPVELGKLSRLEELSLRDNALEGQIPAEVGNLGQLRLLALNKNRLSGAVPSSLGRLQKLEALLLHINQFDSLPEEIGSLSKLTTLKVNDNFLEQLPVRFFELEGLRFLSLSRNRLKFLGKGLGRLKQLDRLWVRDNELSALPESLGEMTKLRGISCSGNRLVALPASVGMLKRVSEIDAANNMLSELPKELGEMTQLRELELGGNQLRPNASEVLQKLRGLERLGLSGNIFGPKFPEFLFQIPALTSLGLAEAKLEEVPFVLGRKMGNLRELDLSGNSISFFRGKFFQGLFQSLETLDLSGNRMEVLSARLYDMSKLRSLSVGRNRLSHLPSDIGLLSSLTRLDISNNRLSEVPPDLGKDLRRLEVLDMHNNPFVCDRRVANWYGPLEDAKNEHDLRIDNADLMVCSAENEFAGQPVHRVRFSTDEPATHPKDLRIESSARALVLGWSFDEGPAEGQARNRKLAFVSSSSGVVGFVTDGDPAKDERRRSLFGSNSESRSLHKTENSDDESEYYGEGEPYSPLTGTWPCNLLGYRVLDEPNSDPKVAFEVRIIRTGNGDTGGNNGTSNQVQTLCTWERQDVKVEGLIPDEAYGVAVRAINIRWELPEKVGLDEMQVFMPRLSMGPATRTMQVRTSQSAPGSPPQRLTQVENRESDVTLSWLPPKVENGEIIQYELERMRSSQDSGPLPPLSVRTSFPQGTLKGLGAGLEYFVRCRAYTAAGPGPWSAPVRIETLPGCLPGFQRQDSPYTCVPMCPEGAYIDKNTKLCTRCPSDFPRTLNPDGPGESPQDCVVDQGYFQLNEPSGRRIPGERRACGDWEGLRCDRPGVTTATVALEPGFWRVGPASLDIRRCINKNSCSPWIDRRGDENTGEEPELPEKPITSSRRNDDFANEYCSDHHRGVLCVECEQGYAIESSDGICVKCSDSSLQNDSAVIALWAICGLLVTALPALWVARSSAKLAHHRAKGSDIDSKQRGSSCRCFCPPKLPCSLKMPQWDRRKTQGFAVQLRIVLGFYQVFAQYVLTVGTSESDGWAFVAALGDLDIASVFSLLRVDCTFKTNYYGSLLVYTLYPFVCICLLGIVLVFYVRPWYNALLPRACAEALWAFLQILFCVYPGLSSRIFRTFLFDEMPAFEGDTAPYVALRADYSVDFNAESSKWWRVYASLMIVVYPFGVVVLFLALTHFNHVTRQKQKLKKPISEMRALVSKAIEFLPRPYTMAWFESYELVRKLVLTSVFILLFQVSQGGAKLFFIWMSALFLWTLKTVRPYREKWDHVLAEGSLVLIFALGLTPYLPGVLDNGAEATFALVIAVLEGVLFAFTATLQQRACRQLSVRADNHHYHDTNDSASSSSHSELEDSDSDTSRPSSPALLTEISFRKSPVHSSTPDPLQVRVHANGAAPTSSLSERRRLSLDKLRVQTNCGSEIPAAPKSLGTPPLGSTPLQINVMRTSTLTPVPTRPPPNLDFGLRSRSPKSVTCVEHS